ncbi:MAG: AAA family ATPase [bacterium]
MVAEQLVCPVLIGRDVPLSAGFHALARAHAAHGGTLLVSGEAGIGKSRFVRAVVERARTLGFLTLQGACFETDRAHPYAPVLDMVRTLAASASPALAGHYFAPARTELVTLFPELASVFPDTLPGVTLGPEEERRRLFHSFTEAVHALGRAQPLLLVIEDLHWSDDATLDLLLHLARRIGTDAIALVLTFRSDETGPRLSRLLADFDRARCASEVGLRPLGVPDVSAMLHSIFGVQAALGPAFASALHGFTEGNPFFIEEMLQTLVVSGDLARADGTWRARPLEQIRVPRTATEAVARRLAGLSAEAGSVASIAAVAGRRFDFALLQALTQHGEADLLSLVKELVDAQLVVEESADQFAFRHALTREAMRARLLGRERVALHRAIATALEAQRGPGHDDDDALAYHTFEAGDWESARHYALRAATRALALSASHEALQHFERAVTATKNAGQQPDTSLLLGRGRAYETLGAFSQANDDFLDALGIAREAGDRRTEWAALHALGMLWAARDYERAGRYRRHALDVARAIGDKPLIAHSLNRVGNWFVNRDDPQSGIPYHDEALSIFERASDSRGVGETVDLLAMSHHIAGAQDTAVKLYERTVDIFAALDDQRALANALSVVLVCGPSHHASASAVCESRYASEQHTSERAIRLTANIGWRAGESFARYLLADVLAWRGEYARALRLARESLAISQEIEHLQWQCGALRVLGVISFDLGASDAIGHLEAAHAFARQLGAATWVRWSGAPLAIALARAGHVGDAAAVLDAVEHSLAPSAHANEPAGDAPRTLGERFMAVARAELAMASGAPAEALAILGDADSHGTPRVALLRAQAFAALERWDDATTALVSGRIEARNQGARPLLWRMDALQGAIHLGARRRLEARRAFDAARTIAAEISADIDDPTLAASFLASVDTAAPPPPQQTTSQAAKAAHGGLTRRERDTAALIAIGTSNRGIARSLGIGERTVEGYVASSLAKLGFSSRAQIAVWAAEQGLAARSTGTARPQR